MPTTSRRCQTDVKDAEWIADLVRHGLVRPSFVPPPEIRELRDLVRHRRTLAETLASERNRTLKLLETANIKLSSVATDVFGVSGTAMLRALVEGDMAPEAMAELAKGRLRTKLEPLVKALQGRVSEHHRFLLRLHLRRLDEIERDLAELETRIAERMRPYRRQVGLLKRIPGVDEIGAAEILAETGIDMTVFGNARRLAAWAGVCPGNHESAGKKKSTAARKGKAANAAQHAKFASYLMLEFGRWDAKRGWTKQLHLGALRNNNTRLLTKLGPDTGFDSIGDFSQTRALSRYLDTLDSTDELPRTVLYNLNPADNYAFATMIGNFQDGSVPGKMQFGSGWWFLDQKEAMEWQINALSNLGLLSRFVGMLTDSRSFLSYPRHEYFRRTLPDSASAHIGNRPFGQRYFPIIK